MIRPDSAFVVFGSLARKEYTNGSDLDWTLLIDGQTHPQDTKTTVDLKALLERENWKQPSPRGIFGSLSFGHSLVHDIGGPGDTYINTTCRVLLLLESLAIVGGIVRDRVIRAVLARYLEEDTHFHPSNGSRSFVPRFLLNDIVRYWRTVAVDYATKTKEHDHKKWALRNIKLRMSRKLIFVSGLLMCFLCQLSREKIPADRDIFGDSDASNARFVNFLARMIGQTPLDLLASVLLDRGLQQGTGELIFDNYDKFLAALDDAKKRAWLENLTYEEAKTDDLFNELRQVSKNFQEGLRRLFFEDDSELRKLSQVYAIF